MNIYVDLPLEDYYHASEDKPFEASGKVVVQYPKLDVEIALDAKLRVEWIGWLEDEIPYRDCEGLGTLYQPGARRYMVLSDKDYLPDKDTYKRALYVFDVYAYIHSGIALSVEAPFGDMWDSGKIGEIVITRQDMIEWFGAKAYRKWSEIERRNMALLVCRQLFADIQDIINGQMYEMAIEIEDVEVFRSNFYSHMFQKGREHLGMTLPEDYHVWQGLEAEMIIPTLKMFLNRRSI